MTALGQRTIVGFRRYGHTCGRPPHYRGLPSIAFRLPEVIDSHRRSSGVARRMPLHRASANRFGMPNEPVSGEQERNDCGDDVTSREEHKTRYPRDGPIGDVLK